MLAIKDKSIERVPHQENWPEFDEVFFEAIKKDPFFMQKNQDSTERLSKLKGQMVWDKPRS